MRFMVIRKADPETEAGVMPGPQLLADMGKYNEELIGADIFQDGAGLRPSSAGARVSFANGKPTVTDGPFAETKELVAGFSILHADSLAQVVDIVKRWPKTDGHGNAQIEIRTLYENSDFEGVSS